MLTVNNACYYYCLSLRNNRTGDIFLSRERKSCRRRKVESHLSLFTAIIIPSRDTKRLENSTSLLPRGRPWDASREERIYTILLCALRNRDNGPFHVAPRVNVLAVCPSRFHLEELQAVRYINSHWQRPPPRITRKQEITVATDQRQSSQQRLFAYRDHRVKTSSRTSRWAEMVRVIFFVVSTEDLKTARDWLTQHPAVSL